MVVYISASDKDNTVRFGDVRIMVIGADMVGVTYCQLYMQPLFGTLYLIRKSYITVLAKINLTSYYHA